MGDSLQLSGSIRSVKMSSVVTDNELAKRCSLASLKSSSKFSFSNIASLGRDRIGSGAVGHAALFLLKVVALETVRRLSRAKCPLVWRSLQAFQFLCYPPFKWIQRFSPFKGLVRGMQLISRPLLVISIATAISDEAEPTDRASSGTAGSNAFSEVNTDLSSIETTSEQSRVSDESPERLASETWLIQLREELERQGVNLPERINNDELQRFYSASRNEFSCFLSSIKKTINWRETYGILSIEELEMWSNLVFWHGFDVEDRPCLIVRLGLGCISLPSSDRPRFAQAIISQVEHGVLHLVNEENPCITVLVDCEGLSPLKVPMHIMRTCSSLLQDHFPNRLGCLFVIRLPPVLRVIAQTFLQILKPDTRKKLRVEGNMYQKVLSEYLKTLPLYLGGKCACKICSVLSTTHKHKSATTQIGQTELTTDICEDEDQLLLNPTYETGIDLDGNCNQVLRTAIISVLMFWIFIAFIAVMYDPESRPSFSK